MKLENIKKHFNHSPKYWYLTFFNVFSYFFLRLDGSTRILTLTQEKFNADGTSTPGAQWNVPIKIMKNNKEVIEVLMEQKELIVKLENVQESDWYKVNPDFYGYYR